MPIRRKRNQAPAVTTEELEVVRRLLEVSDGTPLTVGGPVRCLECTSWGLALGWAPDTRRFDYSCPSCRATWSLSSAAVAAVAAGETVGADTSQVDVAPAPAPWAAAAAAPADGAPAVRITWGGGPATSGGGLAPHPAG